MAHFNAHIHPWFVALSIWTALCWSIPVAAQQPAAPAITSPADGQLLQGQVSVRGSTDIPDFSSSELAFAYASETNASTWFVIQTASLPVANDVIALWDTTSISDGDYLLRLRVILLDGGFQDAMIKVQVRNYTPTATPSPAVTPTEPPVVKIPTAIIIAASNTPVQPTVVVVTTPTALPANPVGVTPGEVYEGFWRGALGVGLVVLLFAVLVRLRR